MDIKIWGPSLWELLHAVAFGYNLTPITSTKKKQYILFYSSIGPLIPCDKCKIHYNSYLNSNSIANAVNSYTGIITWVNNLHNGINAKIGRKQQLLAVSKKRYVNQNGSINFTHSKIYIFIDNAVKTITPYNFNYFKTFFNALYHIFPCERCRLKLNVLDRTNRLSISNINTIKKWYSKVNIKQLH